MTSNRIGDVEPEKRHRFERTGEAFWPTCWRRYQLKSGSTALPPMVSMTPRGATVPSRPEVPMRSYRHGGMPGNGRATIPACTRGTKRYVPANASTGPTGRNGPGITDEFAWKPG